MYNSSVSAMMPLTIERGLIIEGVFRFRNNFSTRVGIQVGTRYRLEFPTSCQYVLSIVSDGRGGGGGFVEMERGLFKYLLDGDASRMYSSAGGYSRIAKFNFFPQQLDGLSVCSCLPADTSYKYDALSMGAWESLWTATDRFSGNFQSMYGIADFDMHE